MTLGLWDEFSLAQEKYGDYPHHDRYYHYLSPLFRYLLEDEERTDIYTEKVKNFFDQERKEILNTIQISEYEIVCIWAGMANLVIVSKIIQDYPRLASKILVIESQELPVWSFWIVPMYNLNTKAIPASRFLNDIPYIPHQINTDPMWNQPGQIHLLWLGEEQPSQHFLWLSILNWWLSLAGQWVKIATKCRWEIRDVLSEEVIILDKETENTHNIPAKLRIVWPWIWKPAYPSKEKNEQTTNTLEYNKKLIQKILEWWDQNLAKKLTYVHVWDIIALHQAGKKTSLNMLRQKTNPLFLWAGHWMLMLLEYFYNLTHENKTRNSFKSPKIMSSSTHKITLEKLRYESEDDNEFTNQDVFERISMKKKYWKRYSAVTNLIMNWSIQQQKWTVTKLTQVKNWINISTSWGGTETADIVFSWIGYNADISNLLPWTETTNQDTIPTDNIVGLEVEISKEGEQIWVPTWYAFYDSNEEELPLILSWQRNETSMWSNYRFDSSAPFNLNRVPCVTEVTHKEMFQYDYTIIKKILQYQKKVLTKK